MSNISIIILTYNEELHIQRCLENVKHISSEIYVIDCFSTDRTVEIAQNAGATVISHQWPGNQAEQFNWALENIDLKTEWILRLDADEYLTNGLIYEIQENLPSLSPEISAIVLPLGRAFMGKILKHGIVNNIKMIRLFRYGKAKYENRLMDEHLKILSGKTITFNHKFIDDNRIPIKKFIDKHNNYSSREAALLLDAEYNLSNINPDSENTSFCKEVIEKRKQKQKYAKMPLFWRSFAYFSYRYFIKLGFLDGKEGFLWDFFQGLWYRMLVDAKIYEIKKACGADKEKIKVYLKNNYNIQI